MRITIVIVATLCIVVSAPSSASARPRKGFHTGPYLAIQVGIMQSDFDRDQTTGQDVGRDFEPSFGFLFGWNIWDIFSAELQGRYATNINAGRREHIAGANLYGKWTMITDALTDFENLRILPFLKGGLSTRIAALPSAVGSSKGVVASFGAGPSIGAGISFLLKKYFYFGIDLQGDLLFFDDINQTVNGVPGTLVYKGGFYPSFGAMGTLGVHY